MEIKDLQEYSFGNNKTKINRDNPAQPSVFSKSISFMIDVLFVSSIRIIVGVLIASLMYSVKLNELFNTIDLKSPTLQTDLMQNGFYYYIAIILFAVFLSGAFYYIYCWSYKRSATFGNTLCKIKIVDRNTFEGISVLKATVRYVLYVLPVLFVLIFLFQYFNKTINLFSFALLFLTVVWYDCGLMLRLKAGVPDLITKTIAISTKVKKK